jgi:hypothetical protein
VIGTVNASLIRGATIAQQEAPSVKADQDLLSRLRDISSKITDLAGDTERYELDADALVDLNLARESVDKLIHRVERILE